MQGATIIALGNLGFGFFGLFESVFGAHGDPSMQHAIPFLDTIEIKLNEIDRRNFLFLDQLGLLGYAHISEFVLVHGILSMSGRKFLDF